jgi:hypothetical protein
MWIMLKTQGISVGSVGFFPVVWVELLANYVRCHCIVPLHRLLISNSDISHRNFEGEHGNVEY